MTYKIHESNMETLQKKANSFSKKCSKYNTPFNFKVIGEKFEKQDGVIHKFYIVDISGAYKVEGWELVAMLELTDCGNQIFKLKEVELPLRFYSEYPTCEHCGIKRYRKHFGILYSKTEGFKIVGKSCLKDFLGQDIEFFAAYLNFMKTAESSKDHDDDYSHTYVDVHEYLEAACDIVDKYGFVSKTANTPYPTAMMAYGLICPEKCSHDIVSRLHYDHIFFTGKHEKEVDDMIRYIGEQESLTDYIHNLKIAASMKYADKKQFGFLASLVPHYRRHLKYQNRDKKNTLKCEFYGQKNDHIAINNASISCAFSGVNNYGPYFVYQITDRSYIFMWRTNQEYTKPTISLTGNIKDHREYKEQKQTWITRCRIQKE